MQAIRRSNPTSDTFFCKDLVMLIQEEQLSVNGKRNKECTLSTG